MFGCALGFVVLAAHLSSVHSQCATCSASEYWSETSGSCVQCPAGYYCTGTCDAMVACARGKFSNAGAVNAGGCSSCTAPTEYTDTTGSSSCTPCPAGHKCDNADASPVACDGGTSANTGTGVCVDCTAGSECLDPTSPPVACADGYYSLVGQESCTFCPAGFSCANKDQSPDGCTSGLYSLGGQVSCTACPQGHMCPIASTPPITCPAGHYTSTTSNTGCTICTSGHQCSNPAVDPVACPSGEYAPTGSNECYICPAGYGCSTGLPVPCTPGTYSVENQGTCTACPAGSRCPYVSLALTIACEAGTFSTGSQDTCTECPSGFACPSVTTDANKVTCSAASGVYSPGAVSSCVSCEAGWACPNNDGSAKSQCSAGTYSNVGQNTCTTCPVGQACPDTTSSGTIVTCGSGNYAPSPGGLVACLPCPPGYSCDSSVATVCDDGYYSEGNQATCTQCSAGSVCPDKTKASAQTCQTGRYSAAGTHNQCVVCPAGQACPNTDGTGIVNCGSGQWSPGGEDTCRTCPAGYQCNGSQVTVPALCAAGSFSTGSASSCSACSAGYYCRQGSVTSAPTDELCPLGSYCLNDLTNRYNCPAGRYGLATGYDELTDCVTCDAGYYCTSGHVGDTGDNTPGSSNLCPRGHSCTAGTTYSTQFPCTAGQYQDQEGQTSCTQCPAGRVCAAAAENDDVLCPAGFFCPAGTVGPPCSASEQMSPGSGSCDANAPQPCPVGKFSGTKLGLQATGECQDCSAGAYCSIGSVTPTLCPIGTYNTNTLSTSQAACQDCPAGFACSARGLTTSTSRCAFGHYCPAGTSFPDDNPCLPGTYTDSDALINAAGCDTCPAGKACPAGTGGDTSSPIACQAGHYCPAGTATANENPCPAGRYGTETWLEASSECTQCTAGSHCAGGQTGVDGSCSAGHYCVKGSSSSTQAACPAGKYSGDTGNSAASQCTECPLGYYCLEGAQTPTACAAGRYADVWSTTSAVGCTECPAGYRCPGTGLTAALVCSKGYYSAAGATACTQCPVGYYCDSETTTATQRLLNTCPAGMFCSAAQLDHVPTLHEFACSAGNWCGEAATSETSCSAGKYNPVVGATTDNDCYLCPAGDYCTGGGSAVTGDCSTGHWCGEGSSSATQNECLKPTYMPSTSAQSSSACAQCPAGFTCANDAQVTPDDCPIGQYCLPGVTVSSPCPPGTFSGTTKITHADLCTSCTAGYYCQSFGLTTPTGQCDAGYYCLEGSATPTPTDGIVGNTCPKGGYCPIGSSQSTPCPDGKFNAATGLASGDQCSLCPAGYYCAGTNNPEPTGLCDAGFYCPVGSTNSTAVSAAPGYFTLAGADTPSSCVPGKYNPSYSQSVCLDTPAGFYSQNSAQIDYQDCPVSHYCPTGTDDPNPCPLGRYSAGQENLQNSTECTACLPGSYCDTPGAASVAGLCTAGYYCTGAAYSPVPVDDVTGNVCPAGSYCTAGSGSPTQCPVGRFRNNAGATQSTDCYECTGGYHCATQGLVNPTGQCDEGYWCQNSAELATPPTTANYGICTIAHYCPQGSSTPVPCAAGTFQDSTAQATCTACPAGSYCPAQVSVPLTCPQGRYCPGSTTDSAIPRCPAGRFSSSTGLTTSDACDQCTAGSYCATTGLTTPTGQCQAGFYCPSGSSAADAVDCAAGFYCPVNSADGTPCPIGKYSSGVRLTQEPDCSPCDPSQYCGAPGLSAPSGNCGGGYYCLVGAQSDRPVDGTTGNACAAGKYCVAGSSVEVPCAAGTYNPSTAQAACTACPSGYFCLEGATSFAANVCQAGYYCPEGTKFATENGCPAGRYSSTTQLEVSSDCDPCPAGQYCQGQANLTPSGNCPAGYYCSGETPTQFPSNLNGDVCPAGSYCPVSSSSATVCPAGQYCQGTGLSTPTGGCLPGYYCVLGAAEAEPTAITSTGGPCPTGHYCPADSSVPTDCPTGTYRDSQKGASDTDCHTCVAGYFCPVTGISDYTLYPCTGGYYCPSGTTTPSLVCQPGATCAVGSPAPVPCPVGYYQDTNTTVVCLDCPTSFYCASPGTTTPLVCPRGSYCPRNTGASTEHLCPAGTYLDVEGQDSTEDCISCPGGNYCAINGLTAPTGLCRAGWYCVSGATVENPEDGVTGDVCPSGKYCLAGTSVPSACPVGTIAPSTGNDDGGDCQPCPPGFYCDAEGTRTGTPQPCLGGFVCLTGAVSPAPTDGTTGFMCTPGHRCPEGSAAELECPVGTYNRDFGRTECDACPIGRQCPQVGLIEPQACQTGFYCPGATGNPAACPRATFSDRLNLTMASECQTCTPGYYCATEGLSQPTNTCNGGYICYEGGYSVPNPTKNDSSTICPVGSYCPRGTLSAIACERGTYNPDTLSDEESDCHPCDAGSYCHRSGASQVSGSCQAGFYCPEGSVSSSAVACPAGAMCPRGSGEPTWCAPGFYQPQTHAISCVSCPAGFYCSGATTDPIVCPDDSYCAEESGSPKKCLSGSHGEEGTIGKIAWDQCTSCPQLQYCTDGRVQGWCSAGYMCYSGIGSATPSGVALPVPLVGDPAEFPFEGGPCPRSVHVAQRHCLQTRTPCSDGKIQGARKYTLYYFDGKNSIVLRLCRFSEQVVVERGANNATAQGSSCHFVITLVYPSALWGVVDVM